MRPIICFNHFVGAVAAEQSKLERGGYDLRQQYLWSPCSDLQQLSEVESCRLLATIVPAEPLGTDGIHRCGITDGDG